MLHAVEGGAFTGFDSERNTHGIFPNVWSSQGFTVYKICVNNRSVSPGNRVDALILLKKSQKKGGAWNYFSVKKVNTQMWSNGNDCQHLSPGLFELKVKQDFRRALYEAFAVF